MNSSGTLISAAKLVSLLDHPRLRLVDCRFDLADRQAGRRAYEAGHLPGAVYAHLDEDLAAAVTPGSGRHPLPDPAEFADILGSWGIDRHSQVVVYDGGAGAIAARLWWMLRWLGHPQVAVLDGGYAAWTKLGAATIAGIHDNAKARFEPAPRPEMIMDRSQVTDALAAGSLVLIDVRARPRYLGEIEPLDKVAGHVPGALNLPLEGNLDQEGRFQLPRNLESKYEKIRKTYPGKQICFMC
ncbi:MAG: sulfurtransferase, partial [Gammaproteobacteria bacterium]|nr:sulfurtransferase [Gammaproteobacteria bacterium]